MKKNVIKIILFLGIIALFILVCISLKKNNYISANEMSNLINDINSYKNVHMHEIEIINYWDSYRVIDIYRKDETEFKEFSGYNIGGITYRNKETKEDITIVDAEQRIYLSSIKDDSFGLGVIDKDDLLSSRNYKYNGIETVNSKECYCFQIKQVTNLQTYWFYKDSGLIAKREVISDQPGTKEKENFTNLFFYEFDTVTDTHIKKPNIEEYKNNGYEVEYR